MTSFFRMTFIRFMRRFFPQIYAKALTKSARDLDISEAEVETRMWGPYHVKKGLGF